MSYFTRFARAFTVVLLSLSIFDFVWSVWNRQEPIPAVGVVCLVGGLVLITDALAYGIHRLRRLRRRSSTRRSGN